MGQIEPRINRECGECECECECEFEGAGEGEGEREGGECEGGGRDHEYQE